MDMILASVTLISLALAAVMGVLVTRMHRDERRRSEARVALLTQLALNRSPRTASVAGDLQIRPPQDDSPVAMHGLFEDAPEPSAWPRRFAVLGALAAFVIVAASAWSFVAGRVDPVAGAAETRALATAPLELVSLKHAREDGAFAITGLVQNPRSGVTLSEVSATLFVFSADGALIASGRAPLDFVSLAPGDESSFVVRVAVGTDVARYRIGFRTKDDRVVAHVDRRDGDVASR